MGGSQCRESFDWTPAGVNVSLPRGPFSLPARACGDARPPRGRSRSGMGEGSGPSLGPGGLTEAFQRELPREAVFNRLFNCMRSLCPPRKETKQGHTCHA